MAPVQTAVEMAVPARRVGGRRHHHATPQPAHDGLTDPSTDPAMASSVIRRVGSQISATIGAAPRRVLSTDSRCRTWHRQSAERRVASPRGVTATVSWVSKQVDSMQTHCTHEAVDPTVAAFPCSPCHRD